ncbi:MAG: class I SAM-dependent methyltransferase [Phormidesmis sp.]
MRPDSATVFADKAEVYATHRPDHPDLVIEALNDRFEPGIVIADVGAGTGRLSQRLARAGFTVKLIEPNLQMRQIATERLAGDKELASREPVTVLAGEAKQTQLADSSVDLVVAGNSAHWFLDDLAPTLAEFRRILKPGGQVAIVYTLKDESSPITQALDKMLRQNCPEYCYGTIGLMNHRFDAPNLPIGVAAQYLQSPIDTTTHTFQRDYSWNDFETLLRTYAFFPRETAPAEELLVRLRALFDQFVDSVLGDPQAQTIRIGWTTYLQISTPR